MTLDVRPYWRQVRAAGRRNESSTLGTQIPLIQFWLVTYARMKKAHEK